MKGNKSYYTIGEVCNLLGLKAHVLRYWEKEFSQVKPQKKLGRNRRYTLADIELLKRIKYMLYEQRFTIDGVRKKLKEKERQPNQTELDFTEKREDLIKQLFRDLKEAKEILKKIDF
jgi:DNA-binding transcriptional MerR regulator